MPDCAQIRAPFAPFAPFAVVVGAVVAIVAWTIAGATGGANGEADGGAGGQAAAEAPAMDEDRVLGAGDYKEGYESADYETRSRSLESRTGREADLYALTHNPPLGLPSPPEPRLNPSSPDGIALGRLLFFDRRLSLNNTMSCAMCHVPEMGFAHNELKVAVGFEGRATRRNAPTLLNIAYKTKLFHDGREFSLENQIWSPLLARNEMANPSVGHVIEKIRQIKEYPDIFQKVFGERGVSMETVSMALAQYQRALLSANSRFDRWRYNGEKHLLSAEEERGFAVFTGAGACSACHLIGERYALFTDNRLHNTGMGFNASMRKETPRERVQLAPGVFADVARDSIAGIGGPPTKVNDVGRYEITQDPNDRWKYVTPTLRNVALTAPYMHNGELLTLEAVVEFYDRGGVPNELLSPLIRPLGLAPDDKKALVAFLRALTGGNTAELVSDAFAAPVGELRHDDPFWSHRRSRENLTE